LNIVYVLYKIWKKHEQPPQQYEVMFLFYAPTQIKQTHHYMFSSALVYLFCIYCILQSLSSDTHKRLNEQTIHTIQKHILTIMYTCHDSVCHLDT